MKLRKLPKKCRLAYVFLESTAMRISSLLFISPDNFIVVMKSVVDLCFSAARGSIYYADRFLACMHISSPFSRALL